MGVTPVVRQWIEEGLRDPEGSGRARRRAAVVSAVGPRVRVELPDVPLVRRRRDQSRLQRARPPRRATAAAATRRSSTSTSAASGRLHLRQLLHEVKRVAAALRGARHRQGRSPHDLHADLARGDRR